MGSLALSEYPALPPLPAHGQSLRLPHRARGCHDRYRVTADGDADALGQSHYGHLCRYGTRLAPALSGGHAREAEGS